VSFFGGGSDYPAWYRQEGGAVLSTSIDKYCFLTCRYMPSFFQTRYRVVWSHIENVNSIAEILHPAVRVGLRAYGFEDGPGLEIHYQGDIPARTGMGSSSAFAVGLIHALLALRGEMLDAHALALKAIHLEQELLQDVVGSQDQVAAAYSGLNIIRFATDGTITVEPLNLPAARKAAFNDHLLLFYTGTSRLASEVARSVIGGLAEKQASVRRMHAMVDEAAAVLQHGDLRHFGEMLDETWNLKCSLSGRVSNPHIDELYATGRNAGALGGKLLGAGSSGFMLFFAPPERHTAIREALKHYCHVPFALDDTGTQLIYQSTDLPVLQTAAVAPVVPVAHN
jgi:D-glycero-alpha-D-manno-heptose-7-phosphate kinase